ncbi:hypothetical protein Asi02nite_80550 [Asanoa siamensis]|uniref:Uncharacterized protein n=1 Tax=Asanoa siamensis TaxID=926357 RepID=A0ABQ4D4S0_9ACTN|nr:hypothetical protein Asi02nite_80550 [Asanoa siamensis]
MTACDVRSVEVVGAAAVPAGRAGFSPGGAAVAGVDVAMSNKTTLARQASAAVLLRSVRMTVIVRASILSMPTSENSAGTTDERRGWREMFRMHIGATTRKWLGD